MVRSGMGSLNEAYHRLEGKILGKFMQDMMCI